MAAKATASFASMSGSGAGTKFCGATNRMNVKTIRPENGDDLRVGFGHPRVGARRAPGNRRTGAAAPPGITMSCATAASSPHVHVRRDDEIPVVVGIALAAGLGGLDDVVELPRGGVVWPVGGR